MHRHHDQVFLTRRKTTKTHPNLQQEILEIGLWRTQLLNDNLISASFQPIGNINIQFVAKFLNGCV